MRTTRPLTVRALQCGPLLGVLTFLGLLGCGPQESVGKQGLPERRESAHASSAQRALRAAQIARVQAGASAEYAVRRPGETPGARLLGPAIDVMAGDAIEMTFSGGDTLSFGAPRYGCAGQVASAPSATARVHANRAEYVRRGRGSALTEWYVNGPMGLEQGFTLEQDPHCGGRELIIEVPLDGGLSAVMDAAGGSVVLRNGSGREVARYGDLYAVDARGQEVASHLELDGERVSIHLDTVGARYPVVVDPLVAVEQATLVPSNAAGYPNVGQSVGISGNTAVVAGSPAYVFERQGDTWVETAMLTTSDGTSPFYVAISGDTIVGIRCSVPGAPGEDGPAYVFHRENGAWVEQAKLYPSGEIAGASLRLDSAAISADTIVLGYPFYDTPELGSGVGAAYVFVREGETWTEQAMLMASDAQGWQDRFDVAPHFGWAVDIDGDIAVIGAPDWRQAGTSWWGAAYVFERTNSVWAEVAKLLAPGTHVGINAAVSGEVVFTAGLAVTHEFHRTNGVWSGPTPLVPTAGLEEAWAWPDVAVEGNTAVVVTNALHAHLGDASPPESGSVYLYERVGEVWVEQQRIVPTGGLWADPDYVGADVEISNGTLVVSALANDFMGTTAKVSVFDLRFPNGAPCSAGAECASGFCVDGVCCDTVCNTGPCDTCLATAGATADGSCTGLSGPPCDDRNACTQVDTCDAGICVGGAPVECPPTDDCHESCDTATGQCVAVPKPDNSPCDDGDACTKYDVCQSGICVPGGQISCFPVDECHAAGLCDPTTGVCNAPPMPEETPCPGGVCAEGQCVSVAPADRPYVVGGCGCETGDSSRSEGTIVAFFGGALMVGRRRRDRRNLKT